MSLKEMQDAWRESTPSEQDKFLAWASNNYTRLDSGVIVERDEPITLFSGVKNKNLHKRKRLQNVITEKKGRKGP